MTRPRIGFAGDREIAVRVLDYLLAEGDRPELLLTPAESRATHSDALIEKCAYLPKDRIFRGTSFGQPEQVEALRRLNLDYLVSVHFPYIYPPELLKAVRRGILNLHPGYLPYGRGWHTPSWAIIEARPFGATLHLVDDGIDTGDILYQLEVEVRPDDTAHTLYQRAMGAEFDVFQQAWPLLKAGRLTPYRQEHALATVHSRRELIRPAIQRIDLDAPTTARAVLQRLRGLTTSRWEEAAYFEEGGRRCRLRVEVSSFDQGAGSSESPHQQRSDGQLPAPARRSGCSESHEVPRTTKPPARIDLSPPHMSAADRRLLLEAFDSNWIAPAGPHVEGFERDFCDKFGVGHAVATSSGTAALHLALLALGVKAGDEVLCSTLTFTATANAIRYCGATPVFIDSERCSWNMDPALLEEELCERATTGMKMPAAVVVVDVFGQCADYGVIEPLTRRYGIPLVVDAAESLGATCDGKPAGAHGDVGCFSFNGNKIITTSGGGMLATEDEALAKRVRHLATQAKDPAVHYEHSTTGFNYRLSNLLAAVGRGQLQVLEDRVAARRENFEFYAHELGDLTGIEFMPEAAYGRSTRWLSCILIDPQVAGVSREDLRLALEAANIESRPLWKPMHLQPVNAGARCRGGAVAEDLFIRGLCLPSGSALTDVQRTRVVGVIRDCVISRTKVAA